MFDRLWQSDYSSRLLLPHRGDVIFLYCMEVWKAQFLCLMSLLMRGIIHGASDGSTVSLFAGK
ncbi:hypothetical protein E2C01_063522 [Portunus trituberculatus]|uniref:Uncharacterized protein n=1 Tax=Portunus trituberculatus TaxID=210409 RepID=A0A5B7H9D4_PORTR|nr:hypothetical protein [Portunus trituberculatus]